MNKNAAIKAGTIVITTMLTVCSAIECYFDLDGTVEVRDASVPMLRMEDVLGAHSGGNRRYLSRPILLDHVLKLVELLRRCTGADGIRENVHLGEAALFDEGQRLCKLLLRLLWKATDQVCCDGRSLKILV